MKNSVRLLSGILIPFCLVSSSCSRQSVKTPDPAVKKVETLNPENGLSVPLAPSSSTFKLLELLSSDPKNVVLSPLSLKFAFGLLYPGASNPGKESLEKLFGFSKDRPAVAPAEFDLVDEAAKANKGFELLIANSIWLRDPKTAHPDFVSAMKPLRSEIKRLELNPLNKWASEKTKGKIPKLLDALKPGAGVVAVNALYLKAQWLHPFSSGNTIRARFQPSPHEARVVPMMQLKSRFRLFEDAKARWLELPYLDSPLVLWIGLPKKRFELPPLIETLSDARLKEINSKMEEKPVDLVLPKFSLTLKESLQPLMQKAGFGSLFSKGAFPKILRSGDLRISEVLQALTFAVDESGTEAAAATAVTLERSGFMSTSTPFYADEPFVFLLRNPKSGEIYFMGRLRSP